MIDNEPKSVKNRATALRELYNYLLPGVGGDNNGKPVKWGEFTRQQKVSSMFTQAIKKLGIVKQISKKGAVECYIWNVGEPSISMAAQVLATEKEIQEKIRAKKELELPKGPHMAWRFPIKIIFRSMIYIKD